MTAIRMTEEQYAAYQARRMPTLAEMAGRIKPEPVKIEKPKAERQRSRIELAFIEAHKASGLPPMVEEFKPFPKRRFRLDFSYPDKKISVECDGAVHRIKARFKADQERKNLLTLAGWRILYVNREHIKAGRAIAWLRELIGREQ